MKTFKFDIFFKNLEEESIYRKFETDEEAKQYLYNKVKNDVEIESARVSVVLGWNEKMGKYGEMVSMIEQVVDRSILKYLENRLFRK